MASTTTTQYDQLTNITTAAIQARVGDTGGKLRMLWFAHTCQSEGVGDSISLTIIPAGARVVDCLMMWENIGNSGLSIGDSEAPSRIAFLLDGSTESTVLTSVLVKPSVEEPEQGFGYRYAARTTILATPDGSLNTGKFWGTIYYVID